MSHIASNGGLISQLKATSECGIARLLTHMRDCGAVFDRIVSYWFITER